MSDVAEQDQLEIPEEEQKVMDEIVDDTANDMEEEDDVVEDDEVAEVVRKFAVKLETEDMYYQIELPHNLGTRAVHVSVRDVYGQPVPFNSRVVNNDRVYVTVPLEYTKKGNIKPPRLFTRGDVLTVMG